MNTPPRITEYALCDSADFVIFERKVNDMIAMGFEPFGSLSLVVDENARRLIYTQPMVRYDRTGEAEP